MNNFIKKGLYKIIFILFVFLFPIISFAGDGDTPSDPSCDPTKGVICNPLPKIGTVPELIKTILEGILQIGIPIVALAVVYCGFLFVKARGKSEEITKAKDALLYTIIGAGILLGSWAIAEMISATVTGLSATT